MNNPAFNVHATSGIVHHLDIARHHRWLDEAYRSTASQPVRTLIREGGADLAELTTHGAEVVRELHDVIVDALETIVLAMDLDTAARF